MLKPQVERIVQVDVREQGGDAPSLRCPPLLLGDRIESAALDVLEGLIEATYTRDRAQLLSTVNLRIEKLRFLTRLSLDLGYLDPRRYEHAARSLDEIGRLVGAWRKGQDAEAP